MMRLLSCEKVGWVLPKVCKLYTTTDTSIILESNFFWIKVFELQKIRRSTDFEVVNCERAGQDQRF